MLLVSYECSRSFAARAVAFASTASTGRAAFGLAVARGTATRDVGLTSCAVGCAAGAAATAATRSVRPAAALAAFPATTTAGTSLPAATLAALVGKLSHCLAARLRNAPFSCCLPAHISRLHQALLIESDQIQATGLRERLHH